MSKSLFDTRLKEPFSFSQSALSDFERCRRLFRLRWIERLDWPTSADASEYGHGLVPRRRFHHLLHQHLIGVDVDAIIAHEPSTSPVPAWWRAFLQYPPKSLPTSERYPEVTLIAPLGAHLLSGKLDLLAVDRGQEAVIVDWKTGRQAPYSQRERASWQTCAYRYLLAEAGAPYWGQSPPPADQIRMIYWFAEYPASAIDIGYSRSEHEASRARLIQQVDLISTLPVEGFTACTDVSTCGRCIYQAYCGRDRGTESDVDWESNESTDVWNWEDAPEYEY